MSLPFEPLWVLALVVAVIWIAALLQSALGFGQALIAMPLVTLLTDVRTASALVAVAGFSATLLILAGQRQQINLREAWRLIVGSALGVPLGVLFLTRLPEPVIVGGLGLMLMVFALYNLVQLQLPHLHQQSLAFGFGALAGMLGGATIHLGHRSSCMACCAAGPQNSFRRRCKVCFWSMASWCCWPTAKAACGRYKLGCSTSLGCRCCRWPCGLGAGSIAPCRVSSLYGRCICCCSCWAVCCSTPP